MKKSLNWDVSGEKMRPNMLPWWKFVDENALREVESSAFCLTTKKGKVMFEKFTTRYFHDCHQDNLSTYSKNTLVVSWLSYTFFKTVIEDVSLLIHFRKCQNQNFLQKCQNNPNNHFGEYLKMTLLKVSKLKV